MKQYYLLGTDACREYLNNGFNSLVKRLSNNEIPFSLYYYHPERCTEERLKEILDRFTVHLIVTEEEFETLELLDD